MSSERELYEGVKKALTLYLRQGDDQIAIMLDITADGFPQTSQALLQSNVLILLNNREARPDLFGHIGPDCTHAYGRKDFVLTVEVKPGIPSIHDLFQAKKYGELYWAPIALLVSTELPEERRRRLLSERLDLFGYGGGYHQLYLCRYSESSGVKFTQIYVAFFHPVEDFVREDIILYFLEVGMDVASGERNFINKEIFGRGRVIEVPRHDVTVKRIGEIVSELKEEGFSPNAMLAPLDMYVEYIQRWLSEAPRSIQWRGPSRETLVVDNSRLPIFWSNNYVKFNDFAILSSATGKWVVKPDPDSGRALRVRISRSSLYPETRVEVIAKTVVNELKSPNGIRVLKLT